MGRKAAADGDAPAPRVVAVLAVLLERAAARGDAEGLGGPAAAFGGRTKPAIGVRRYAERIYRYARCSPACFVAAYAYLGRLACRRAEGDEAAGAAGVDSYSVHRLLITSVMVAAKFMDDIHHNNAYFARVGGVEVAEMNELELKFLFAMRFRLNVTPDSFAAACAELECQMLIADMPPPFPEEEKEQEKEMVFPAAAAHRSAVEITR